MFNQPNPLDTKICEKISFQFTLYYYIILLQSEPLKLSTKFDENNDSFGSFWWGGGGGGGRGTGIP